MLVADHKSFAEAARRMHVSSTAVSRGVSELEHQLGTILLRRTTRSVTLTPEGAVYAERCRRILDELDDADRAVRGEDAEPRGALLVTAPAVFGRMHVLPILSELMTTHAGLKAHLMLSDRVVRLVEEGIDVAVRIADLSDSALHAVRLTQTRRVLVASPHYLDRHGFPTQAEHLHAHALIVVESLAPNLEWRFTAEGKPAIRLEPRMITNSVEAAIDTALQGLGIARALSYQVQDHVRAGRLRYLLVDIEPPPLPIHLVFQAHRRRTANVSAFIAAAQAYCRDRSFA